MLPRVGRTNRLKRPRGHVGFPHSKSRSVQCNPILFLALFYVEPVCGRSCGAPASLSRVRGGDARGVSAARIERRGSSGLIEDHYDDVLAYCRRHTESADEAQDAAQEVFLRFVRTAKSYRDAGKPLAYLLTIARTFAWTRSGPCAATDELPTDEVLADPAPSDTEIFSPAGMDGLRHAIALLTAEEREVLELRFDQELTFAEIGRVMGISRFAARRRLDGALAALRELLKSGEEDVK